MKGKWFIGIIITVACIAFGIFLPSIVFSADDKKIITAEEVYSVAETNFDYTSTLFDVMEGVKSVQYSVECNKSQAQLTEDEVKEMINDFISGLDMKVIGFSSKDLKAAIYADITLKFVVMGDLSEMQENDAYSSDIDMNNNSINNKNSVSIIWDVYIQCNDYRIYIMLDDKNKKIVSFTIFNIQNEYGSEIVDYEEASYYIFDTLKPYLEKYYEVDIEFINDYMGGAALILRDKDDKSVDIYVQLNNGININGM